MNTLMNQKFRKLKCYNTCCAVAVLRKRFSKIFLINLPTSPIVHKSLNILSMSVKRYFWEREDRLLRRSSYRGWWSRTCCSSSWTGSARRRAELSNSVDVSETFQPIPTGFHIELVRARSQPANYFADAGLLVEVKEKPGKWNGTVNGGTVSRVLAVFSCS